MQNTIYSLAVFILTQEGDMQAANPLSLEASYRDERIEISGLINPQSREFEAIYVNINLPSNPNAKPGMIEYTAPFTIPKPHPVYETSVYQWRQGKVYFERRGLWESYLEQIALGIRRRTEALQLLNGIPVDDSVLFGDVPLNPSA